MKRAKQRIFLALLLGSSPIAGLADEPFVAGVDPAVRPASAPVITEVEKDSDWYASALEGVQAPYPSSLQFLESQGNWFNPFLKPGMTGPYDIRDLH